ncbi:rhomboid-like protein [Actinomadura parmotrematis]|uniref:Rhomboid family intramembrane serine protease n=1 Tax=Actinomadura parmotrematis TaxID=2864039 RepID=A0ABS7FVT5_9ACTN|nr:rhomboid-like protein [Actinomadura parmotrematis]MBW8484391.1 hypothetical protein [Actinomadura parmotrematis]
MMDGFFKRYAMPLTFLGVFAAVAVVQVHVLSAADRDAMIGWASTNLANLAVRPVGTLVASAFVAEGAQPILLVFGAIGLFPVARRFGTVPSVVLVAAAHVVGTLVSEGVALARLELGLLSSSIRTIPDVGPSYVLSAALVAAILYGPGRLPRLLAAGGLAALVPVLFEGLDRLEVAAVGHLVAMVTGGLVGGLLARRQRRRGGGVPPLAAAPATV